MLTEDMIFLLSQGEYCNTPYNMFYQLNGNIFKPHYKVLVGSTGEDCSKMDQEQLKARILSENKVRSIHLFSSIIQAIAFKGWYDQQIASHADGVVYAKTGSQETKGIYIDGTWLCRNAHPGAVNSKTPYSVYMTISRTRQANPYTDFYKEDENSWED